MKIVYQSKRFSQDRLAVIDQANAIIAEYQRKGFDLTLRQLYYQFVSRDYIPNNEKQYKKLGDIIADGRMAGLIDWDAITDRTRFLRRLNFWDSPQQIVQACAGSFRLDKWDRQDCYIEVFIEKDALIGVIQGVCQDLEVPYLACRGYASASEIWNAGHRRFKDRIEAGKMCYVLYLGDHDPSGIDMSRDVQDRLDVFTGVNSMEAEAAGDPHVRVVRLALNMNQVNQYQPPPNPTKMTDSRAEWYVSNFGHECWELDALNPEVIAALIRAAVEERLDHGKWNECVAEENEAKKHLKGIATGWEEVLEFLRNGKKGGKK